VGVVEVERGEVARERGAGDCWRAGTTVRESKLELAQSERVERRSSSSSSSPFSSADSSPATALSAQPGGLGLQQVAQWVLCLKSPAVPGLATLSIARPPLSSAFPSRTSARTGGSARACQCEASKSLQSCERPSC